VCNAVEVDQTLCAMSEEDEWESAAADLKLAVPTALKSGAPVSRASSLPSPLEGTSAEGDAKINAVTHHSLCRCRHEASTNAFAANRLQLIGNVR
jgi:hypothetical protein